jgi:hypothetical protein
MYPRKPSLAGPAYFLSANADETEDQTYTFSHSFIFPTGDEIWSNHD